MVLYEYYLSTIGYKITRVRYIVKLVEGIFKSLVLVQLCIVCFVEAKVWG